METAVSPDPLPEPRSHRHLPRRLAQSIAITLWSLHRLREIVLRSRPQTTEAEPVENPCDPPQKVVNHEHANDMNTRGVPWLSNNLFIILESKLAPREIRDLERELKDAAERIKAGVYEELKSQTPVQRNITICKALLPSPSKSTGDDAPPAIEELSTSEEAEESLRSECDSDDTCEFPALRRWIQGGFHGSASSTDPEQESRFDDGQSFASDASGDIRLNTQVEDIRGVRRRARTGRRSLARCAVGTSRRIRLEGLRHGLKSRMLEQLR